MKIIAVQDFHNPIKVHVFKISKDHHIWYNQEINRRYFYPRFERTSKRHGYYKYLKHAMDLQGVKHPNQLKGLMGT